MLSLLRSQMQSQAKDSSVLESTDSAITQILTAYGKVEADKTDAAANGLSCEVPQSAGKGARHNFEARESYRVGPIVRRKRKAMPFRLTALQ